MANYRKTGITTLMLLIITMVILVGIASTLTGETNGSTTTETDYDQMVDDVVNEISTYIQIKDSKAKFYKEDGEYQIQKISLLISPMVSQDIDLSHLTVQIDNGEMVNVLYYKESKKIGSDSLFENSLWELLNGSNFGLLSINDYDNSVEEYDLLNENSDLTYLSFNLPSNFYMKKYDKIKVTLFPSTGIQRTILLKAPMPMESVITFE